MKNNIVLLWLCYFQKLLYKIIPVYTKLLLYQGDGYLAILLYKHFIHLTQITLRPKIQLFEHTAACLSGVLFTSWFYSVYNFVTRMNMNYNYLTTIYESIFAQMYKFLVEKYIFPILLIICSW